jgi:hypothetical protein
MAPKKKSTKKTDKPKPENGKPLTATVGEVVAAKTPPEVVLENFVRRLKCPLTDTELLAQSRQAADLRRRIRHEEQTITTAKAEYDGTKKSCESNIAQFVTLLDVLTDNVNDGAEYRDVDCQRVKDPNLIQVREYRTDRMPHELIMEPRAMTPRELDEIRGNWEGTAFAAIAGPKPVPDDSIPFGDEEDEDEDEDEAD